MSLVTRLISQVLVSSGYAAKCRRERTEGRDPAVTILAYHRIGTAQADNNELDSKIISASPAGFDWQMDYLNHYFTVLSFEKFIEDSQNGKPIPPNAAIITFDDGYLDNYEFAYPVLKRYNFPATIFLISGLIGTSKVMWWDEVARLIYKTNNISFTLQGIGTIKLETPRDRLIAREKARSYLKSLSGEQLPVEVDKLRRQLANSSSSDDQKRVFLNWEEVKEMEKNRISFGAHTRSHPILTRISNAQARLEICESKSTIEQALGKPVTSFAYPNGRPGDFNEQTQAILSNLGFKAAVTLVHGCNTLEKTKTFDWFALRRIYIGSDDRAIFIAKTSGALEKFRALAFTRVRGRS
jgi:peptidoglycan/xylan/chitin deacetylase (PgdA/CDA1 family)